MDRADEDRRANSATQGLSRRANILRFLFRYRNSGVFAGLTLDPAMASEGIGEGSPDQFARDLEALGPTFVKLGQLLSTRPDIVPPAYASALERMQEHVAPIAYERVREVVEDDLGLQLNEAFVEFDTTPLGSASLAQVHRATLHDGTEVAVKVQKPDIRRQLMSDLDVLRGIANAADRLTKVGRHVLFADWLTEFSKIMMAELDYVAEAENLERFGHHLSPFPELWVPQPIWDLTSRRVLTMDLVIGTKVNQISGVRRTEESMEPLAAALICGYLDQVFVHGEIHADPHPGNLRVTHDDRLAIFDLGMIAHVPPRQRDRLLKLLFAAVDGRGEQVAEEAIGLSTRLDDYDEQRFMREIGQLISRYAAHAASVSEGTVVTELVRIGTACGLRTPPELSLLGKTLLNLDAVSRSLSPRLAVKPLLEEHLQRVMRARLRKSLSSANVASELMELQLLMREGPRKLTDILSLIASNRLQVRMMGLEESHLMENLQKIANRISAGVVTAALILASAQMMRIETQSRLWGYPTIALLLFLLAVGLGLGIVISAWLRDRRVGKQEERGPQ